MKGWCILQHDVNNAFLHGLLAEDVFMEQPTGFVRQGNSPLVCELKKALYGLKQAPRAWYERLSLKLHSLGFITSKPDTSLLLQSSGSTCCYVLVHVDDIIIMGTSSAEIDRLIIMLHNTFALKDLGSLNYILGIEVSYPKAGGMFLSQTKYISDLLIRTKISEANPISTPMVSGSIPSAQDGDLFHDTFLYRSTMGALQYATVTHPEISYSVNKACQFMHSPTIKTFAIG